jgi:hypothetical protein
MPSLNAALALTALPDVDVEPPDWDRFNPAKLSAKTTVL